MALFFSTATAAGVFGGLLARGISEMAGVGGKSGWAWIFILEGLLTLCVGSISFLVINDCPSTYDFLHIFIITLTNPQLKIPNC
jgi:MFS family permease